MNNWALEIRDEYDVQNLLHAILKLHFEDIRPEEWAPSYAASSKRMDFLLAQPAREPRVVRMHVGTDDPWIAGCFRGWRMLSLGVARTPAVWRAG